MSEREGRTDPSTGDGKGRRRGVAGAREVEPAAEAVTDGQTRREMGFYERGKVTFKQTLREATDFAAMRNTPYGLRPVLVFTIISAVLAVDGQVVSLAIPEIIRDLDIDIIPLIGVFSIMNFFLIFIVLAISWLADRVRRTPFIGIGAIVSGIFSALTAAFVRPGPNAYVLFGATRGADAVGEEILSVPVGSLMADYYPPEVRGKVYAFRGVLARTFRVAAPIIVAGLVTVSAMTWRFPFVITAPLLILAGAFALVALKEPIRGYMERKALGMSEEEARRPEEPVSFGEAWRSLWAIRTMRRLFIAQIFASPAEFIFGVFFTIFLFERYGLNIRERAFLYAGLALVALPFGLFAGGIVDVLMRRRPQRVLIFTGSLSVATGVFLFLVATGPPLWVLAIGFALFGAAGALIGPAKGVIFAQIFPAHIRTMGFQMLLLAAVPGTIARFFIVQYAAANWGTQGALFSAVPLYLLSAVVELSAAGFFERDMRASFASQVASMEWRKAHQEGRGKLLVCRDVDVEYDGVQVLFGVDFDVDEGEMIALLGTNGAGKSTLLKAIAGSHEASNGAVVFNGRDITHSPPHENAGRGVVLMPGGKGIFPDLSVAENLELANWMAEGGAEARGRLEEVYRIFPVLEQRKGERAQLLSGGEQQMLSLGQAFLSKPKLLMIDELSLGLAPQVVSQLVEIVKRINEQGTTVIIVEQSVNVALTVAERAIFMEKGEVKFVGATEELLRRPDVLRAVYVKGTGALTDSGRSSGVKSERERRSHEIEAARPVLEVKSLYKRFGGVVAVDGVTFDLREGEALGLIGPNGAGKTTVFDLISGYQAPDGGSIALDGVDIMSKSPEERARLGLIRRFQDARLFPSLSVYENILVSLEKQMEVRSMALHALQVPQARQAERRVRLRADRLIELLQLGAYRDKFVKELSTGLRRITDIACILASEPKVLLLDEPSTGIAQAESESLAPLLRRVLFETGCSLLVIEHDMPLISALSDELIAMDQGSVVHRGDPEDVLNDERVIESYLGTSEDVIRRSDTASGKAKKKRQKARTRKT